MFAEMGDLNSAKTSEIRITLHLIAVLFLKAKVDHKTSLIPIGYGTHLSANADSAQSKWRGLLVSSPIKTTFK